MVRAPTAIGTLRSLRGRLRELASVLGDHLRLEMRLLTVISAEPAASGNLDGIASRQTAAA